MNAWELVFKTLVVLSLLGAGVPWALVGLKIWYKRKMVEIRDGDQDTRERIRDFIKATSGKTLEKVKKYMGETWKKQKESK